MSEQLHRCRQCKQKKPANGFYYRTLIPTPVLMTICRACVDLNKLCPKAPYGSRPFLVRAATNVKAQNGRSGDLTLEQWLKILDDSQGRCHYCSTYVGIEKLAIEHVFPASRGGKCTVTNIVASCRSCNSRKGPRPLVNVSVTRSDTKSSATDDTNE